VIEVTPAAPGLPEWLDDFLHTTRTVLINAVWLFGLVAGLILSWGGGGSLVWSLFWSGVTVYVTALLWDWVGRSGWSVLIPLVAIGAFCVAVF
jgi:hypothetical protein